MPEPGGGAGGPLAPPIFAGSVNPILTGEVRLFPPITTGPPTQSFSPSGITAAYSNICTRAVGSEWARWAFAHPIFSFGGKIFGPPFGVYRPAKY